MNTKTRIALSISLALACGLAAAQSATITERTITLDAAMELAKAGLEACRANGFKVSVTVLNRHARTAVVLSEDGVNPHTVENSMRKAYTAFTTKGPSGDVGKRPHPQFESFMVLDKITSLEGGLPIFAGKELVGAIGISGAPGGEKDAACAQVGLDKIAKGLGN
jgi:uncharacterized protein GlcG (DUF336 family)